MDVVEDYLAVQTNWTHEELVQGTETEALNETWMLVELTKHLPCVGIVKADGTVVGDGTQGLLHQIWKLHLIYGPCVICVRQNLTIFVYILDLINFLAINRVEDGLGPIQVDHASFVTCRYDLVVAVHCQGGDGSELQLRCISTRCSLRQICRQFLLLKIPNLGHSVSETSTEEFRILREDKRVDRCISRNILSTSRYDLINISLNSVDFLAILGQRQNDLAIVCAWGNYLIVVAPC